MVLALLFKQCYVHWLLIVKIILTSLRMLYVVRYILKCSFLVWTKVLVIIALEKLSKYSFSKNFHLKLKLHTGILILLGNSELKP